MSKPNRGLGKGLSALIHPVDPAPAAAPPAATAEREQPDSGTTTALEISRIRPNPLQPRADFDPQALDELKESIRLKGVIQAVTVHRTEDGMYELISGERRIRAATEVGLRTIPAYIIEVSTREEMLELALIENLQREHLNPIEIAISYQRLMSDVGLTPDDVGKKVSKDRTTVVNFLRLLRLPQKIQEALRKGVLTMGHARALAGLAEETMQLRIFDKIVKKDLNVRQTEKLVREAGKTAAKPRPAAPNRYDSNVTDLAEHLQRVLGTRVRIQHHADGRGEIQVEFYSDDDLGRLFDLMKSIRT
ncbi:MAG TPA: ParB/RepB/Spo0J family partition protein [Bacteroidota bacterium]|nr:ParB/RepB/Spo0J family partition protein [Bacteroidota bacterium]